MGTLNASDKIFATVSYAGRTVLNTSFTGEIGRASCRERV